MKYYNFPQCVLNTGETISVSEHNLPPKTLTIMPGIKQMLGKSLLTE